MQDKTYISIEDCCSYYSIETSFIRSLGDYGLIELHQVNQSYNIHYEQLSLLEKFMHLHYDLDINMEGIEAINNLLEKINRMQEEIRTLKSMSY